MKRAMTIFTGLLLGTVLATAGTPASSAWAAESNADSAVMGTDGASGPLKTSLAMTESGANVLVVQEPPRVVMARDGFISVDTVIIGCTAGAAAGALAIALPVLTVAASGIGLPASASAILGTAGIGCAVGVVSGLAAIGTAWGLNQFNQSTAEPALR